MNKHASLASILVDNESVGPAALNLRLAFRRASYTVERNTAIKILVIEDDKLSRLMLCKILQSKKYTTIEAPNGAVGFKMFMEQKPDLILTDILMPEKEGLETILEIRACDADIPIIAMSGGGYEGNLNFLKMAAKLGATRTLTKPFKPSDILLLMSSLTLKGTGFRGQEITALLDA
ncbi:MAG: Response regulator, CheY-like receiver [Alphaproteobacteria bacterium]|jgi:CheY-like chemotaxis protein|nr:Response regulator, CheY-like receiver [Alphaproteobacteria bacterium]